MHGMTIMKPHNEEIFFFFLLCVCVCVWGGGGGCICDLCIPRHMNDPHYN